MIKSLPVTNEMAKAGIHYADIRKADKEDWIYFNGYAGYLASEWTLEEAIADYGSDKRKEAEEIAFMKAYGFYD